MSSFGFLNSHKKNDAPPSYAQAFQMDNIATAPLLHETFLGSIFGTATEVKFEWDTGSPENYSFIIRDTSGYLQAKGNVVHLNTTLHNINGLEMLKIFKRSNNIEANSTFEVHHNNEYIGSVTYTTGEAAECLKICSKNANSQVFVRSLKLGDFAMFRDHSSSIPICNMHMPVSGEFNGTIIFRPETGITDQEQLLCTAAAIVFIISIKEDTTRAYAAVLARKAAEDASTKRWRYILGCLFVCFIIGIIVIFVMALQTRTCEKRKKLHYPGYENKHC